MEESESCACMLLFSVFMIKLESWMRTKTKKTQAFHILVPSFFSRCMEYNFLLPLLRNSCYLIDPFVLWHSYKAFESIPSFWRYSNNLQECSKPGNFSFRNIKSFQPSSLIKKTVSKHQSRGKQTRPMYLYVAPD